jgi:predicted nucleic acid-binding protein
LIVLDTSVLIDALSGERRSAPALRRAIAACALTLEAPLWTRNPRDFSDLPGLQIYRGA